MITIGYITSRKEPQIEWFLDSLVSQEGDLSLIKEIVIVSFAAPYGDPIPPSQSFDLAGFTVRAFPPKPTVWAGPHRLTKEDWWAASNARNTWLCLANQPWSVALDDRCVLVPGWLKSIEEAIKGNYAVFGSYEKRSGMKVEGGVIVEPGVTTGVDSRETWCKEQGRTMPMAKAPPEWSYGCNMAFPTAWGMEVNGWDETCDGCSAEDSIFGMMLANCGKRLRYDYRMKIIEDRTPGCCDPVMIRRDKGVSPKDKSHAQLELLRRLKRSRHQWDLPSVRTEYIKTGKWPIPTGPTHDWYDGQPLSEMTAT